MSTGVTLNSGLSLTALNPVFKCYIISSDAAKQDWSLDLLLEIFSLACLEITQLLEVLRKLLWGSSVSLPLLAP